MPTRVRDGEMALTLIENQPPFEKPWLSKPTFLTKECSRCRYAVLVAVSANTVDPKVIEQILATMKATRAEIDEL